jgi:hypothetical protein
MIAEDRRRLAQRYLNPVSLVDTIRVEHGTSGIQVVIELAIDIHCLQELGDSLRRTTTPTGELARRYLNDPGSHVDTIRLEPGPSGGFRIVIVLVNIRQELGHADMPGVLISPTWPEQSTQSQPGPPASYPHLTAQLVYENEREHHPQPWTSSSHATLSRPVSSYEVSPSYGQTYPQDRVNTLPPDSMLDTDTAADT